MKKLVIFALVLIVAAACSSVNVSSDFDRTAGFSSYKTFLFTDDALHLPLDDINNNRILTAVESELVAKGFKKVTENPDVLIDIKIKAQQKQTATATTSGGYGYGYRYGWGGGFSTTQINYDTYTDGTMFIDMIDAQKKQLVWQGRGTKTVNPDDSEKTRAENLSYAIKQIMAQYPPKF